MAIENPRLLKEITEYKDLLNARDDALKVVNVALSPDFATAVTTTATTSVVLKPTTGGVNINSVSFNKYLARYIEANLATIGPEVITLIEAEIATNKAEAEEEAGLLGLVSSPVLVPAPSITSALAMDAIIGSAFSYEITASNTDAEGVTEVTYTVADNPSWITLNQSFHTLVGTVPTTVTAGESITLTIGVTTNGGTDTKQLVITFKAAD